jgi:hypothetical protein
VANEPGEVILPGEWEKAKQLIADGQDINYEGATGSLEFDENGDVPGVIEELVIEGDSSRPSAGAVTATSTQHRNRGPGEPPGPGPVRAPAVLPGRCPFPPQA